MTAAVRIGRTIGADQQKSAKRRGCGQNQLPMGKNMKTIWKNKKGFTLVEAIVAFALTAVLLTAAGSALASFFGIFWRVNADAKAQAVAGTVMEKVIGELDAAKQIYEITGCGDVKAAKQSTEKSTALTGDADTENCALWYKAEDGRIVHLYVDPDGQLVLSYEKYVGERTKREEPEGGLSEADGGETWRFPEAFYGSCTISGLKAECVPEKQELLQVSLAVCHRPSGVKYEMTRVVECRGACKGL